MTGVWSEGYRAALADVCLLAASRGIHNPALDQLLDDLINDALVVERESTNLLRRRRLRAEREALPLLEAFDAV